MRAGVAVLEASGYRVTEAPHLYDRRGYLAGTDRDPPGRSPCHVPGSGGEGRLLCPGRLRHHAAPRNPALRHDRGAPEDTPGLQRHHRAVDRRFMPRPAWSPFTARRYANCPRRHRPPTTGSWRSSPPKARSPCPLPGAAAAPGGAASGPLLGGNLRLLCHLPGDHVPALASRKHPVPRRHRGARLQDRQDAHPICG